MKVEAFRTEKGILIPYSGELHHITDRKIFLEVNIIDQKNSRKQQTLSASELFGIFRHRRRSEPVSIEEMETVIRERRKQ
ncbi:MAG: hypothetical protein V2I97_07265 [Desulfococcaceae bacterium]|jgi:hypothetical protein|nr:hypothetical protein [Desulfococcaceae bacterium]